MILTACTTGTEALFVRLDQDGVTPRPDLGVLGVPVEAWDDQGAPMVAGRNGLVPVGGFRSNRFMFARLSFRTSASAPDAEEPQRWPIRDPGDGQGQGGGP